MSHTQIKYHLDDDAYNIKNVGQNMSLTMFNPSY